MLEMIWQCDDSSPFREPVDIIEHPDYNQIIDTPMDLLTIKEDLIGGNYQSPIDFVKDMRLIFENSKNYNTNKRSRVRKLIGFQFKLNLTKRFLLDLLHDIAIERLIRDTRPLHNQCLEVVPEEQE